MNCIRLVTQCLFSLVWYKYYTHNKYNKVLVLTDSLRELMWSVDLLLKQH